MGQSILFYISGHGYGHARRSAQVIRSLQTLDPAVAVHVRSTAPARLFRGVVPPSQVTPTEIDAGAAEISTLEIDAAGTLNRVEAVLSKQQRIVEQELEAVRRIQPRMIVSDIPFLAGAVAQAAGLPCWGMSNFSWDWVIEPFVQQLNRSASALEEVSRQYASMAGILRMPLGGISDAFAKVIDVPLVANRSRRTPDEVLRVLRIDPHDDRRRVLFAMRGAISPTVLAAAVASAPDALILCPADEHADIPPGAHPLPIGDDLDFSDVLQVCDVVVGKMGYALTAECILSGATLLWPRRKGFREDAMVERIGPRVMRMHELPLEDFRTGQWAEHIRVAGKLPRPPETMPTDGAEVCASHILAL